MKSPTRFALLALAGLALAGCATTDPMPLPPSEVPAALAGPIYNAQELKTKPSHIILRHDPSLHKKQPTQIEYGGFRYIDIDRYRETGEIHIESMPRANSKEVYVARIDHPAGEMEIDYVVDENGKVIAAKIISATHPDFAKDVCRHIGQWDFVPGEKDGVPVKVRMRYSMKYGK